MGGRTSRIAKQLDAGPERKDDAIGVLAHGHQVRWPGRLIFGIRVVVSAAWIRLRSGRRPPGSRKLAYFDQGTLSRLATEAEWQPLAAALRAATKAGSLVCPEASAHSSETMFAAQSWEQIHRITDDLALGVSFREERLIRWGEIYAVAEQTSGHVEREPWREAFSPPEAAGE
jgi:hypothetical protein